jgi:hypothetical protein
MRAPAFLLAGFLLALPAPARAQSSRLKPPPLLKVTLAYERAPGLAFCPDDRALRLAVRAELGYDPFVDDPAPLRFKLSIVRSGGKIGAVMELRDDQGALVAQNRDIKVDYDCKLLVDTVGDTVSAWLYRPPTVEPCPACPACPPPPEPPPPPPPPEPPERAAPPPPPRNVSLHAGIDLLAHFAIMPTPGLGPGVFVALRLRDPALSFELDARASWTLAASDEGGTAARGSYFSGTFAACSHVGIAFLCPTAGLGTSRFAVAFTKYAAEPPVGTLGARAGIAWPFGERFAFRSFLDVDALLGKSRIGYKGAQVWEAPSALASVGLGVVARLW